MPALHGPLSLMQTLREKPVIDLATILVILVVRKAATETITESLPDAKGFDFSNVGYVTKSLHGIVGHYRCDPFLADASQWWWDDAADIHCIHLRGKEQAQHLFRLINAVRVVLSQTSHGRRAIDEIIRPHLKGKYGITTL